MIISVPKHFFEDQRFYKTYNKHSIFNHTINFISDDRLISLHDNSRFPSPMGIILNCSQDALRTIANSITSIRITSEAIYLDNQQILKEDIRLSNHNLLETLRNHHALNDQHMHQLIHEISEELNNHHFPTNQYTSLLNERIKQLQNSLINKRNIQEVIEKLIGFGEGLTPSGDDVICGLMVGILYQGQDKLFNDIASYVKCILQNKINATSIVSRAFLAYATQGLFIENVLELYKKLLQKESTKAIIKQIATLGHSSGTDFLRGIMLGNLKGGNYNDL